MAEGVAETKRVGLEVSVAIGDMVKLADADVIAAYPITPQTHIVEHLAELVANEPTGSGLSGSSILITSSLASSLHQSDESSAT